MNRVYYLSLYLIFLTFTGLSQSAEIEALKKDIATQPSDSSKVNNLIALSSAYLAEDPKQSIEFGTDAQKLAQRITFKSGEAYAFKAIGLGYFYLANYSEAAVQFQHSLALFD